MVIIPEPWTPTKTAGSDQGPSVSPSARLCRNRSQTNPWQQLVCFAEIEGSSSGSVENPLPSQEHYIVRECLEHQRACLAPVAEGVDRRVESALDNAEHRFHLRPLAIRFSLSRP